MKNVVLIGFMGTGKTSTGKLLAQKLGRVFIDTDQKIEEDNQMTIAEMFAIYNEAYFRDKETQTAQQLGQGSCAVIATGGGIVLRPQNVEYLRQNGIIIRLTASLETIIERTARRNTRPLLNRPDRDEFIAKMMAERAAFYDVADLSIDTSGSTPQQVCDTIIAFLRQGGRGRGRC